MTEGMTDGQKTSWWLIGGSLIVTVLITVAGLSAAAEGRNTDDDLLSRRANLGLVAGDEFAGPSGALPTARLWNIRTGGGGWGNNEKQIYTATPDTVALDGAGHLRITAHREGNTVSSARIDTLGRLDMTSGLLAVRARMPQGQGIHPAIWLLGSNLNDIGYPRSGEIDVYEQVNSREHNSVGVIGPRVDTSDEVPWKVQKQSRLSPADADGFHTYWVSRRPGLVEIGMDERTLMRVTPADLRPDSAWVMDGPFFVVLNVAAGGMWPGPVGPGALPASMLVDWVRLYA